MPNPDPWTLPLYAPSSETLPRHRRSSTAKYSSTHTSSSWSPSHGAADQRLLGDAFAQTHIHTFVCIFICIHYTLWIHRRRRTHLHWEEKVAPSVSPAIYTCATLCTVKALSYVAFPELRQLGWGKVGSKTQVVRRHTRTYTHTEASTHQPSRLPFSLVQHWSCSHGSPRKRSLPHASCLWGSQVPPVDVIIVRPGDPRRLSWAQARERLLLCPKFAIWTLGWKNITSSVASTWLMVPVPS